MTDKDPYYDEDTFFTDETKEALLRFVLMVVIAILLAVLTVRFMK